MQERAPRLLAEQKKPSKNWRKMSIMLHFRHDRGRTKISFSFLMAQKDLWRDGSQNSSRCGVRLPQSGRDHKPRWVRLLQPARFRDRRFGQRLSIDDQVDRAIAFLSRRYNCRKFIAYFQSFTNTYAESEHLSAIYGEALARPEVVGLAIGTRPDCVPDPVLDLLADVARDRLVWVEYGLQSIHTRTLESINRGHGPDAFFDAVERTQKRGIPIVVHLILGLPGESLDDMRETARAVAAAGVSGVKLHPLYVIRGTGLEKLYLDGEYHPMTEEEAIEATMAMLELLPWDVVVHRMTSDPHPEELAAPLWMLDRAGVRRRLEQAMKDADFRQGSGWRECQESVVNAEFLATPPLPS